jgi:hypothetical protein
MPIAGRHYWLTSIYGSTVLASAFAIGHPYISLDAVLKSTPF